jgi:rhodanese-related sulfurtransferase/predicted transcriptional regulator
MIFVVYNELDIYSSIRLNRFMKTSRKRRFKNELYDQFARLAKALGSGRRIELIDLLVQGERTVEALAEETEQSVANTSQHLQVLRHARLVETTRAGNYIRYRVADEHVLRLWFAFRAVGEARLAEIGVLLQAFLGDRRLLQAVSCDELRRRIDEHSVVVLDVRPALEYDAGHIHGARSIPITELRARLKELRKSREVVAYCRGPYCVFADEAVELLRAEGYKAFRLEVGFPEWKVLGFPIAVSLPSDPAKEVV